MLRRVHAQHRGASLRLRRDMICNLSMRTAAETYQTLLTNFIIIYTNINPYFGQVRLRQVVLVNECLGDGERIIWHAISQHVIIKDF